MEYNIKNLLIHPLLYCATLALGGCSKSASHLGMGNTISRMMLKAMSSEDRRMLNAMSSEARNKLIYEELSSNQVDALKTLFELLRKDQNHNNLVAFQALLEAHKDLPINVSPLDDAEQSEAAE